MLNTGSKIYRNLQEQVGFNTEQIEKIFKIIDGLNVEDSVVIISDLATPLTAEELAVVSREVAFIVYDGQIYIKKSQDAFNAYFDIVFTISSSSGIISLTTKEIIVTLSNGALGQTTSTESAYSKTEIDSLLTAKADITYVDTQLALCAKLTGANFTGAITGPSIIENMTGYSFVAGTSPDATIDVIFAGIVKNGNKLTLALFVQLTALTDWTTNTRINLGNFNIPSDVASKLIPVIIGGQQLLDAKEVDVYGSVLNYILKGFGYCFKGTNQIGLGLYTPATTTGNVRTLRIEETFLLSENLAS